MIHNLHGNNQDITERTLAAQRTTRIGIARQPDGYLHVTVRRDGTQHVDRHAHATVQDALLAAARIARLEPGKLFLIDRDRLHLIWLWERNGERHYATGRPLGACVNSYECVGWWGAAAAEAVREEAESKPGLDCEVDPAPTLEEALALQEAAVAERIAANNALLAGEVR